MLRPRGKEHLDLLLNVCFWHGLSPPSSLVLPGLSLAHTHRAWHALQLPKTHICVGNHSSNTSPAPAQTLSRAALQHTEFWETQGAGRAAVLGHCRWESVKLLQKVREDEDYSALRAAPVPDHIQCCSKTEEVSGFNPCPFQDKSCSFVGELDVPLGALQGC